MTIALAVLGAFIVSLAWLVGLFLLRLSRALAADDLDPGDYLPASNLAGKSRHFSFPPARSPPASGRAAAGVISLSGAPAAVINRNVSRQADEHISQHFQNVSPDRQVGVVSMGARQGALGTNHVVLLHDRKYGVERVGNVPQVVGEIRNV